MFSSFKTIPRSARASTLARLIFALVAVGGGFHAFAADATSQPATQPTTKPADIAFIAQSLSDLANPDAQVREAARTQLMGLARPDLPTLQRLLKRTQPLAPSQAAALRQIVQEVYLAGEAYAKDPNTAFLGIEMENGAPATQDLQQPNDNTVIPGVVVEKRIPGFCASRMLRDGDIMLGTVDPPTPFSNFSDVQKAIAAQDPGSLLRLQVLREGQMIEVPLILDCRPIEIPPKDIDSAEHFRDQRIRKFDEYWQANFANLLVARLG